MSKKYIIQWNTGYGDSYEIVEADDMGSADEMAYERWQEDAEFSADYSAQEYTKQEAIDLGLEEEE